jgi:hypothetical protein
MRPLLWFLALSVAVATTITGLGLWLLVAPVRAGRALNEWYAVIPLADTVPKRATFRAVGVVLLVVGARYGMTGAWGAVRAFFN